MKIIGPLVFIALLLLLVYLGTAMMGLEYLFAVVIPYAALALFLGGFIHRIYIWAKAPVPYRVPTTAGQAKSLSFIKRDPLESPHNTLEVIGRMALEVLAFRSLFRNTQAKLSAGPNLRYITSKWLWLGAIVFHWAMLVIVLRHYRFFLEPIPFFVPILEAADGFMQISLPTFYLTNVLFVVSLGYLLVRRITHAPTRYISLSQDYFPLYLLIGIALTGILMRYGLKTDVYKVKVLIQSLTHFRPEVPAGISPLFYMHLFLVSTLAAYFPFSKLMHAGGVFMSPTRNLANNSREKRHINPVNPQVKMPSYAEYEAEFKEKMVASGIPLDQEK